MNRITDNHLQAQINHLNRITGSPLDPWIDGKAQVGNFHLSHQNGGVCLNRMYNEGGAATSPLSTGHITKKELHGLLCAFIAGINLTGSI